MSKKSTKKAATKTETPTEAKASKPREKKPKEPMRTFAIRITDAELAAIHRTAGPRNATRLMRAVAAAFAAGDEAAFRQIVKEASTTQS